ncbi:MAG TPA: SMC-Scp complex subunit ScpB [Geobacterales bacterium]|nr:SMC-Scp complex subunit ScpB [Geobacterales bacterium]
MAQPPLRAIVESLLFVVDEPLSLDRLATLLEEFGRDEIRRALREIADDGGRHGRGIVLEEVAGGFQLRTPMECAPYIRRLGKSRPFKLSQSALETLSIIAYRQPITRSEIEQIRGVDVGGVVKTLLDRKLIRILGKKDIPGKPLIYGTSREFLQHFNLKDLTSLPTLKEIEALALPTPLEQQEELPLLPPVP